MLTTTQMSQEDDLARYQIDKQLAEEEILKETQRAAVRASQTGALGWKKCPLRPTDKVFLRNTLIRVLGSNRHKDRTSRSRKELQPRALDESGGTSDKVTSKDSSKSRASRKRGRRAESKKSSEEKDLERETRKKCEFNKRTAN